MIDFLPFFVVLFAGLFLSELFFRFHFPWVITLLIGGMVIGPHGFGVLETNSTIEFLSQIGLVFLMFLAGLETNLLKHGQNKHFRDILPIAFLNGAIPFIVGFLISYLFGYGIETSLLIGIIFISSSLAVIVPTLETSNLIKTKIGQMIIASSVIVDIASLILLSVFLQSQIPGGLHPLIFYPLLAGLLVVARYMMPKIIWFFRNEIKNNEKDIFQQELRAIFVLLIGTVIAFELMGLHPIISGFFAGMVLSDSITSNILKGKIRGIGYGIFVPTFFIVIGTQTDFTLFFTTENIIFLTVALIISSIASKFISGYVGARISKLSNKQSLIVGSATIPQLSTTLAVAASGLALGIIDQALFVAIIALSVLTVLIGPILVKIFASSYLTQK